MIVASDSGFPYLIINCLFGELLRASQYLMLRCHLSHVYMHI